MVEIKWTEDKIKLLQQYYPNASWDFLFEILKCNDKNSIKHKASSLKLKREIYYYSKADVDFLINNYNKMSIDEISIILHKTKSAIMTKANKLNLISREKWSSKEIVLLTELYGKYTNEKLSKDYLPNRTVIAITRMAEELHLYKNTNKSNKKYNEDDMILELQQLAKKLKRTPNARELTIYNLPSDTSYRRYFGSYRNACKIADLEYNIYLFGEKRIIKKSINDDVCFSNAETIITDFFINNNIFYKKEAYYRDYITDDRCNTKRCDWVIKKNVFVEYFGMPNKSYYYKKMQTKRDICKENNIQLIELFEKDLKKLNTIFL